MRHLAAIIGLTLTLLSSPLGGSVSAYVLEQTTTGEPLRWPQSCITWWMHEDGASTVGAEQSRDALRNSFDAWQSIDGLGVEFVEGGITCHREVGYDHGFGQQNVIFWHNEEGQWPYTERIIGLTTLTFDLETGEIVDVDMEFNAVDFRFGTQGEPNRYDLQTAVTHEVGHMIGLGHTTSAQSVMYPAATVGDTSKRTLSKDDMDGALASHGEEVGIEQLQCRSGEPASFEDPYCPQPHAGGCQTGNSTAAAWLFASLFILLCRTRRSRQLHLWMLIGVGGLTVLLAPQEAKAQPCNPYAISDGTPVFWTKPLIALDIDDKLPEGMSKEAWWRIVEDSLSPWTALECLLWDIELTQDTFTPCPGEIVDDQRQCIYWVHGEQPWPFSSWQLAVTLVHYRTDNGEIVDTDMALNGTGSFDWSTAEQCDPDSDQHDLQATLTHEFGHLLGLDHSSTAQATMHGTTREADCTKRTLHEVDINCLCDTSSTHPTPWVDRSHSVDSDASVEDAELVDLDSQGTDEVISPPSRRGCQGTRGTSPMTAIVCLTIWLAWLSRRRSLRAPGPARVR